MRERWLFVFAGVERVEIDTMELAKRLRTLLRSSALIMAPGAYDALTARLIESAGFPVVYMSGYGTAATYGVSDTGIIGFPEMLGNAARIARAITVPLIADADTGYDDPEETTRADEAVGVAGIQLEDQTWPKKCGHMEGKTVVPVEVMEERISAALRGRSAEGIVIVARTDAIAVEGFDAAIERAARYADAGADVLFIEAPETLEQVEEIPKRITAKPLFYNVAPKSPALPVDALERLGYSLAIYPGIAFAATMLGVEAALVDLMRTGNQDNLTEWATRFGEWNAFLSRESEEESEKNF